MSGRASHQTCIRIQNISDQAHTPPCYYELINNLSEKGVSILLVSSELEEVMGLADRAYLVQNGETINEIIPNESSIDDVLFELFDAKKELINE